MRLYRYGSSSYSDQRFCPSTKSGNLVNWEPSIIGMSVGLPQIIMSWMSIGFVLDSSLAPAFFWIGLSWLALTLIAVSYILLWTFNSVKIPGATYRSNILPVEIEYEKMSKNRRKQYKHLVAKAYRRSRNDDIVKLFRELKEDRTERDTVSDYVSNELEIIRRVKEDMQALED
jgi:hypothetical protein